MSTLFAIVNALDVQDLHAVDWPEDTDQDDDTEANLRFEFNLTERDQKWVILDAMQRQIADDPHAENVSSEHILCAIADNGYPSSLEFRIETYCERVLMDYQKFQIRNAP